MIKAEEPCIILHQGKVYDNQLFDSPQRARNYVKFKFYNRKFKEIEPNTFSCTRYGTTFKIVELKNDIQ